MKSRLSVVIPTANNRSEKSFSISYTIRALLAQINIDAEIIVVNDNGNDGTADEIRRRFPKVQIVESERPRNNLGCLRNLGSSFASGEVLVFVDDDTVLNNDRTLSGVAEVMQSNDFCCGAHRYWTSIYWHKCVHVPQSMASIFRTLKAISILPRGINKLNGFRDLNEFTFIGNFGAIRRDKFISMGGFDEGFPGWGFEDTEFLMRLCLDDTRYALLHELDISVIHLTHSSDIRSDFISNMRRFNDLELQRGYYFHINHFFGVYEADGFSLLSPIGQ